MSTETISLLVDDEKVVLESLRDQVRRLFGEAIECETAESADEAWEVLDEVMEQDANRVILVVSDWLMPRIKGDEFLERVRDRYPSISRVLLTGQADQAALDRIESMQLVDRLLFKPWKTEELREMVDAALER